MKVTNADVWLAQAAGPEFRKAEWPIKVAYRLVKQARKIAAAHQDIERVRNDLVMRHGKANERGQVVVTQDMESYPAFAQAFNELMAIETEIDTEPVVLPWVEGMRLTTEVLMNMGPFITMEDDA